MDTITKAQFAVLLNITPSRVSQYVAAGLSTRRDGSLNLSTALNWVVQNIPAGDDPDKGAARAEVLLSSQKKGEPSLRSVVDPLRVPPPPFLAPVDECSNPFDAGCLFGLLMMFRELRALGAMAVFECGLSQAAAESVGDRVSVYFASRASEWLHTLGIGRFAEDEEAVVWPAGTQASVDWQELVADPVTKRERRKWGA